MPENNTSEPAGTDVPVRCPSCHRRLGDLVPPVGGAEYKCACGTWVNVRIINGQMAETSQPSDYQTAQWVVTQWTLPPHASNGGDDLVSLVE